MAMKDILAGIAEKKSKSGTPPVVTESDQRALKANSGAGK